MPRLLLLLAIILVAYILLQRARTLPPHKRRGEYIKLGIGIAVAVVIFLAITGRMHWVGAALAGLLVAMRQLAPLLIRLFPMLASSKLFEPTAIEISGWGQIGSPRMSLSGCCSHISRANRIPRRRVSRSSSV